MNSFDKIMWGKIIMLFQEVRNFPSTCGLAICRFHKLVQFNVNVGFSRLSKSPIFTVALAIAVEMVSGLMATGDYLVSRTTTQNPIAYLFLTIVTYLLSRWTPNQESIQSYPQSGTEPLLPETFLLLSSIHTIRSKYRFRLPFE